MTTTFTTPGTLAPVLSINWGDEKSWTLDSYRSIGGWKAWQKAQTMEPAAITEAGDTLAREFDAVIWASGAYRCPNCERP